MKTRGHQDTREKLNTEAKEGSEKKNGRDKTSRVKVHCRRAEGKKGAKKQSFQFDNCCNERKAVGG